MRKRNSTNDAIHLNCVFICQQFDGLFLLFCFSDVVGSSYPWLEQISRQEQLLKVCDSIKNDSHINYSQLDHILIDHQHKLLYCYVPKVACTNWKRVLMVLTGRSNASNLVDISATLAHDVNSTLSLPELSETEAQYCLNNYINFLMVRHPFERLLSAYRNKFESSHPSAKYFQVSFIVHVNKIKTYFRGYSVWNVYAYAW